MTKSKTKQDKLLNLKKMMEDEFTKSLKKIIESIQKETGLSKRQIQNQIHRSYKKKVKDAFRELQRKMEDIKSAVMKQLE